jgi:hypothetical protein
MRRMAAGHQTGRVCAENQLRRKRGRRSEGRDRSGVTTPKECAAEIQNDLSAVAMPMPADGDGTQRRTQTLQKTAIPTRLPSSMGPPPRAMLRNRNKRPEPGCRNSTGAGPSEFGMSGQLFVWLDEGVASSPRHKARRSYRTASPQ